MSRREFWASAGTAAVSGLLLFLAFPPLNVWLLTFVAAAPFLAKLRDVDSKTAAKLGYLFGLVFFGLQMFWIVEFVSDWTGSVAMALIPWAVATLLGSVYYLLLGWGVQKLWARGWVWAIPLAWAGVEALRAQMPYLMFPWANVSTPLWVATPVVQHAALGTQYLVSAWAIIPNLILAMIVWPSKDEARQARVVPEVSKLVGAFGTLALFSIVRYGNLPEAERKIVTLGQPGVDMAFSDPEEELAALQAVTPELVSLALAQGSELLILPEGFARALGDDPPFSALGSEPPLPVLLGATRLEEENIFQSAFAFEEGAWSSFDKTRLVIFGEYVPFRDQLGFLDGFNLPSADFTAGEELRLMRVAGMDVAPMVCFEGLFADLADRQTRMGAQVIAIMSIEDWFADTWAYEQLLASGIWRSIEGGVPVLKSSSTGSTLATNSRGALISLAPQGETRAIRVEVDVPVESDAFQYRMAFVYVCWAVFLIGVAPARARNEAGK